MYSVASVLLHGRSIEFTKSAPTYAGGARAQVASRENQLQSQLLTKDADIEQLVLSKIQLGHDLLGRDAAIAELQSEVRTWRLRVDELMAELIGEQSTKAKLAAEYAAVSVRPRASMHG